MRYSYSLALLAGASLGLCVSTSEGPDSNFEKYCASKGQAAQKVDGRWKCVQTSDICGPEEDMDTFHEDPKTGKWVCCPQGQVLKGTECVKPNPPEPQPDPMSCSSLVFTHSSILDIVQRSLVKCCSHKSYALTETTEHFTKVLKEALYLVDVACKFGCDKPNPPEPSPGPNPGPWWKCPKDSQAPCHWLSLEPNQGAKALPGTGSGRRDLPNPLQPNPDYVYPFDTWVKAQSGGDLEIFIDGVKAPSQGSEYLIKGGTAARDIQYKSSKGVSIQFYGACSEHTPCLGSQVKDWTLDTRPTVNSREVKLDLATQDSDVVITLADVSYTTEQYTVLADGKEIGKTHGRLTLGDDMWNKEYIKPQNVVAADANGAHQDIANDGFWGSFRIPKGTREVTVRLNYEQPGWPSYWFIYRVDKLCKC